MNISVEIAFSFKRDLDAGYRTLRLLDGATVLEAFRELARRYPEVEARLFEENGEPHRHINALVNGENVQFREKFETRLREGDRLTILPPVGGG